VPNREVRIVEQLYMPLVQSRMMIGVKGFGRWVQESGEGA
jgi:hypothetical protein